MKRKEETEFLQSIGANIRRIREEKKIKQNKLAGLCEMENANMSRVESGQANMTMVTLLKISKALDVPVLELIK